jgi:hypothetical protein
MVETEYGKYVITHLADHIARKGLSSEKAEPGATVARVLYLDDDVLKGAFYVSCAWYLKERSRFEPHSHDFDEALGFIGTNPEDPHDLCGEIELWLDEEIHILTKSCLVFMPQGLKHTPLIVKRVDRPIFHFSTGPRSMYGYGREGIEKKEPLSLGVPMGMNKIAGSKYGRNIITKPWPYEPPKIIEFNPKPLPPDVRTRVVCLDDQVIKGGFYTGCSWLWKGSDSGPQAHIHDFDEVLGFFGTNMEDPHDLCGEVELWLANEKHTITKSCLIFVPKQLKHCPLIFRRADRPVLHLFIGNTGSYSGEKK